MVPNQVKHSTKLHSISPLISGNQKSRILTVGFNPGFQQIHLPYGRLGRCIPSTPRDRNDFLNMHRSKYERK